MKRIYRNGEQRNGGEWAAMANEKENINHIWDLSGLDFKVGDCNGVWPLPDFSRE